MHASPRSARTYKVINSNRNLISSSASGESQATKLFPAMVESVRALGQLALAQSVDRYSVHVKCMVFNKELGISMTRRCRACALSFGPPWRPSCQDV